MKIPEFTKLIKGNGNTYTLLVDDFIIRGIFDFGDDINYYFEEKDINDVNFSQSFQYINKLNNKEYSAYFKLEPYETLDLDEFIIVGSVDIKEKSLGDIILSTNLITFNIFSISHENDNMQQSVMIETIKKDYNLESILIELMRN